MRDVAAFAMAVAWALALAACSMVESIPIGIKSPHEGLSCKSQVGAYYLPKTLLVVEVLTAANPEAAATPEYAIRLSRRIVADDRFGYCLDYLGSTTANDTVDVRKLQDSHLLGIVSTDAVDQSRYILQTLIRALFVVASGNPQFPAFGLRSYKIDGALPVKVFHAEYDPFDPERSALINAQLKRFGFCLVLGPYTVNAPRNKIDDYCDDPKHGLKHFGALRPEYQHSQIPEDEGDRAEAHRRRFMRRPPTEQAGIYYRPRMPYQLDLYLKYNLKAHGDWKLRLVTQVPMENISPLILAKVDRTFFAERKTTLVFAGGMLERVCVYKGSELLQASFIPLQIVQSVVALPTQILLVRIDNTKHEAELAQYQRELVKTQIRILQQLDSNKDVKLDPSVSVAPAQPNISPSLAGTTSEGTVPTYDSIKLTPKPEISNPDDDKQEWNTICPTKAGVGGLALTSPGTAAPATTPLILPLPQ